MENAGGRTWHFNFCCRKDFIHSTSTQASSSESSSCVVPVLSWDIFIPPVSRLLCVRNVINTLQTCSCCILTWAHSFSGYFTRGLAAKVLENLFVFTHSSSRQLSAKSGLRCFSENSSVLPVKSASCCPALVYTGAAMLFQIVDLDSPLLSDFCSKCVFLWTSVCVCESVGTEFAARIPIICSLAAINPTKLAHQQLAWLRKIIKKRAWEHHSTINSRFSAPSCL